MCRSKHVEPSINFGIINYITRLHLVGISTEYFTNLDPVFVIKYVYLLTNFQCLVTDYEQFKFLSARTHICKRFLLEMQVVKGKSRNRLDNERSEGFLMLAIPHRRPATENLWQRNRGKLLIGGFVSFKIGM